ncbi:AAA family ATPase [Mesorhizobium sp. MSK_1335]|uniref:DNA 3'-5' helicase n=1 Tax=Mesorhizobium montanum TaxID=3072323 RepID=A0ABU4ZNR0_9HYPH|nr:UvrD-helicase domain-containing protein [Mesorhizobium sp. MSK_1335]MDX8527001.1 AAA family ATPase [Mesorhizobium sp. MSK_1335]
MTICDSAATSADADKRPDQCEDDASDRMRALTAPATARMLVEAGPGTGKTEIAALRLAGLVTTNLSPAQILVLSFSRNAVRTLTRRMVSVAGTDEHIVEELRHISVRTFDSWAFRILRLVGRTPEELLRRSYDSNISAVTDMIVGQGRDAVLEAIGDRRHLIVDEFQDLPGARGELVLALLDLLAPPDRTGIGFTVLGDPAQAIFSFSAKSQGSTSYPRPTEYWRRIVDVYGSQLDLVRLTRNYRSTPPIAEISARLRAVLLGDYSESQKLEAVKRALAALPETSELSVSAFQGHGSTAILTRTNGEALRVLTKLMGQGPNSPGVPIRMRAASYATLPPAWIAALLRPVRSGAVTKSQFDRIYQHLTGVWNDAVRRQLGLPDVDTAWSRLAQAAGATSDAVSFELAALRTRMGWPDAFPDDQPLADDGLIITTVHQSKGSEFDVVTILESATDFRGKDDGDTSPEEEANVSYVAMTRAAKTLHRSPSTAIYTPPTNWTFRNDRTRLCNWWGGWINLEMGQKGDVDPFGFVDPNIHGQGGVEKLQSFLLTNAHALEGRKVVLCRRNEDGKATWLIHLQEDGGRLGLLLGVTSNELTFDLLHILHPKGYGLPWRIYNLRISGVGTITSEIDRQLDPPETSSRLWLGVSLFGTGDFQPKSR